MVQAAASLSSSLLVAKGQASAQGFTPRESTWESTRGSTRESTAPTAVRPLLDSRAGAPPRHARLSGPDRAARQQARRVKVSLRLDPERHLRLKLAAAHLGHNGQRILTAALDRYLEQVFPQALEGRCHCLEAAAAVARGGSGRCGG